MKIPKRLAEDFAGLVLSHGLRNVGLTWLGRPFSRPFSRADRVRVCVYFDLNEITFAQVFPFIYHAAEFRDLHNCEFRFYPMQGLLEGQPPQGAPADRILILPWFNVDRGQLARALEALRKTSPDAVISFVDSFAHNDLRLASELGDVAFYIKKSLFRDRSLFLRSHKGDTNLTEFYGTLYGLDQPRPDWAVPEPFLDKLRLGPTFFTAPRFLQPFDAGQQPRFDRDRPIDLHMRLGTKGSGWYGAMRSAAVRAAEAVPGVRRSSTEAISYRRYVAELQSSKICFSPFGYGEICWRDIEAFAYGAVLIKPDMGHLETSPDIYVPGVTYLPVKWDFSDLSEVVATALGSPDLRRAIAGEAHRRISGYLQTAEFVRDMAFAVA